MHYWFCFLPHIYVFFCFFLLVHTDVFCYAISFEVPLLSTSETSLFPSVISDSITSATICEGFFWLIIHWSIPIGVSSPSLASPSAKSLGVILLKWLLWL